MINKKSIYKEIFQSQINVIFIFGIITTLIFTTTINMYIKKQNKNQLISTSEALKKTFKNELLNIDNNDEDEINNSFQKVNDILKEHKLFLEISYIIVNKNGDIIFPKKDNDKNILIAKELINNIDYKNSNKKKVKNINKNNLNYDYLAYEIDINNKDRYLILYSDLNKKEKIVRTLNLILIGIMAISTIIALIISRVTSKKLTEPIYKLIDMSKEISKKIYPVDYEEFESRELDDLAQSMINMSKRLNNNDNIMKTFVENSSHELRTPLMSIQGYAEGIKYNVIDDKDNAIDIIINESKRMSYIVEELLYLSMLDSIEESAFMENLDIDVVIKSAIERISGIALKEKKKIVYSKPNSLPLIMGSEEKLIRALLNLISNSLRYAKETVIINVINKDNTLIIIIEDDGEGFNSEDIDKVFNRFYKGQNGNCGLGLTIAKTIINNIKGDIFAENREEGGARIRIVLGSKDY